jgi:hypothetical protein
MPVVKSAHGRHEPDSSVLLASHLARHGAHALAAIDYLHKKRSELLPNLSAFRISLTRLKGKVLIEVADDAHVE